METWKDQSVVSRGWGDGGDIGAAQESEGRKSLCTVRVLRLVVHFTKHMECTTHVQTLLVTMGHV